MLAFNTDAYLSAGAFTVVFVSLLPMCAYAGLIYPLYKAQKQAHSCDSALVGSAGVERCGNITVLSVDDREIFPPEMIKIAGMRVYGENRIDDILRNLSCVFEKLKSPVADVFTSSAQFPQNYDRSVRFIEIAENGLCVVTGGMKLFIGKGRYVGNLGLMIPIDKDYDDAFEKSFGSIMYIASEDEVISKLHIKYEVLPDFRDIVKNLYGEGICLGLRTFDPNIDNALLGKLIPINKRPVRIIKLNNLEKVSAALETADGAIVSTKSFKSLTDAVIISSKQKYAVKTNIFIHMIMFVFGILLCTGIAVTGNIEEIDSWLILLYQLFWIAPIMLLTNISQRN
jgi:hypothetical protein